MPSSLRKLLVAGTHSSSFLYHRHSVCEGAVCVAKSLEGPSSRLLHLILRPTLEHLFLNSDIVIAKLRAMAKAKDGKQQTLRGAPSAGPVTCLQVTAQPPFLHHQNSIPPIFLITQQYYLDRVLSHVAGFTVNLRYFQPPRVKRS